MIKYCRIPKERRNNIPRAGIPFHIPCEISRIYRQEGDLDLELRLLCPDNARRQRGARTVWL